MSKKRNTRIKLFYTKLGREKVWGHADTYPLPIDERLKGKKKMEIVIHECMHLLFKNEPEEVIESAAIRLTMTLWHEGARFVDNDEKIPLQDGSK